LTETDEIDVNGVNASCCPEKESGSVAAAAAPAAVSTTWVNRIAELAIERRQGR
jgi:hypothetical protein